MGLYPDYNQTWRLTAKPVVVCLFVCFGLVWFGLIVWLFVVVNVVVVVAFRDQADDSFKEMQSENLWKTVSARHPCRKSWGQEAMGLTVSSPHTALVLSKEKLLSLAIQIH